MRRRSLATKLGLSIVLLLLLAAAPQARALPPDCSLATASPSKLWPPNHAFREIAIVGVLDPDGDDVAIRIDAIFQDEPVIGGPSRMKDDDDDRHRRGRFDAEDDDGDDDEGEAEDDDHDGRKRTFPDAEGIGSAVARVRAERSGRGDGRVYHIQFSADDGAGGTCSGSVTVCVPHDRRHGGTCGDQGPLFDSTGYGLPSLAAVGGVSLFASLGALALLVIRGRSDAPRVRR